MKILVRIGPESKVFELVVRHLQRTNMQLCLAQHPTPTHFIPRPITPPAGHMATYDGSC